MNNVQLYICKKDLSVLKEKSYHFAVQIISLYKSIISEQKEYVLSRQVLRSGTAIGALIAESTYAQSKADFISKLNIALKEAHETEYWLCLLVETGFITDIQFETLRTQLQEILKILIASIKTAKSNIGKS